ncbi:hypothetical protein BsIDN1_45630 [Bacillus safensis]|uniref:Uncharacterized protein n=1 Tax=Bacillus safensis TaxID=561879 RepID=A0A5S9MDI6_BACIA|nr:hypothetical protein BsIDN1_45630 [Bacillus safensis]
MAAAVEKALAPVVERVEALEKARPQGNGVGDAQQQDLQKSETVWYGAACFKPEKEEELE